VRSILFPRIEVEGPGGGRIGLDMLH
jgi:hypothetical protein